MSDLKQLAERKGWNYEDKPPRLVASISEGIGEQSVTRQRYAHPEAQILDQGRIKAIFEAKISSRLKDEQIAQGKVYIENLKYGASRESPGQLVYVNPGGLKIPDELRKYAEERNVQIRVSTHPWQPDVVPNK
jgi:hypothetical protein